MNVKEFIEQHDYISYCEAIIHPSGDIEYATPSHIYKLIEITEESRDELNKKMPMRAGPLEWLVEYTGCAVLWYNYFIFPVNYTDEQMKSLKMLMSNGIMASHIIGSITQEKTTCELLAKFEETGDNSYLDKIKTREQLEVWR